METDKERLLLCYQVNQQVVQGKFPLNRELAFELASLMAQVRYAYIVCIVYRQPKSVLKISQTE